MKIFFEQCLRDLHQLTGLKQYIEICNLPSKEEARTVFNALVDSMVVICNQYPYIPDTEKQKVIKSRMMDTPEFYGLNARFVKLALERVKDLYWKESGYLETNALLSKKSNAVPFEELPEETQRLYNETMAKLAQGTIQTVDPVNAHDLKVIASEDEQRVKKTALSVGYKMPSEREILRRELHIEWLRENVHPQTKELTGIDEREWLLDKGYFIENGEIKEI